MRILRILCQIDINIRVYDELVQGEIGPLRLVRFKFVVKVKPGRLYGQNKTKIKSNEVAGKFTYTRQDSISSRT